MSVRALGAVWRVECEPVQKLLLLALADHANDETFDCWPSLTHLSQKTGLGRSTIARALNALEASGLIVREQREKQSTRYVLKVSRWSQSGTSARAGLVPERDGGSPRAGPPLVPERDHNHQSNHQGTILEAKRAARVPKNSAGKGLKTHTRGTRLPSDWTLPAEWRAWARAEYPTVDVDLEAAKFADYWHARTGAGATKADWLATWRNWVRNARGTGMPRRPEPAHGGQVGVASEEVW